MMDHSPSRSSVETSGDQGELRDICIAATFTSEPIREPLQNNLAALSIRPQLRFAPYRQIIPQLLSQRSDLTIGGPGVNIFLLRAEDFSSSRGSACGFGKHKTYLLPNGMEIAHLNSYETKYLYEEIFEQRVYERNGVTIRDGDTVIDIGANIGMFALSVIERNPRCRVVAFEPSPAAFEVLSANAQAHGRGNIVAARCGVWSTSGSKKLTYYPGSSVFSGFCTDPSRDGEALRVAISNALDTRGMDADRREELTRKFMEERLVKEERDCAVRSLSDLVAEYHLQTIDLLKIDAEGSELEILSGVSDEDWARIDQIVIEVHESAGVACSDICAVLSSKGYRVQVHQEAALAGAGLKNVYATRDAKRRHAPPAERLQNLHDFASCLERFADANRVHCIVGVAPPSPGQHPADHEELVAALSKRLRSKSHVQFLSFCDFGELEISDYYDETRDRAANIPYKPRYFDFMSSTLSSVIASIVKGPRKVIALDADGTLWDGVCAEERAEDLRVNAYLQEFVRDRAREGMLLCLVSKNNMEDVRRVFAANPDMVLKWSDFAAVRANWGAKSANLTSLSAELGLSLESFVFLDDNPVECAEVRANCPQVLALCLPGERERIPAFLDRVCFFQILNVTDEDGRRGQVYRENVQREQQRSGFDSLREYIESLRLEVVQERMTGESVGRVAQLTSRTNQFNVRKITRRPDEIEALLSSGYQGYVARVKDRFGDYGLTGAVIYQLSARTLRVETFLLSCRVLGRGVEYELARRLGSIALEKKIDAVIFDAVPTDRNAPAMDFLSRLEYAARYEQGATVVFEFSPEYLAKVSFDPDRAPPVRANDDLPVKQRREESSAAEIEEAADMANAGESGSHIAPYITRVVRSVRDVPRRKLSPDRPFAAWGIDSFALIEILVRLEKDFGRLPGTLLFDRNTIDSLGEYFMEFHGSRVRELAASGRLTATSVGRESRADSTQLFDLATISNGASRRLSYNQEAMWISHSIDQGALAYNVPLTITMRGEVDESILRESLRRLVLRHEVLRTRFVDVDGVVTCEVDENADIDLPVIDLSHLEKKVQDARIRALMDEESSTRFDLERAHPIRSKLVRISRKRHLFLLTLHHLVSDGWSVRILLRDLAAFYDSFANGEGSGLEPLRHCYRDYVRWEECQYQEGNCEQRLAHWKKALEGAAPLLRFPLDRARGSHRTYASEVYGFSIPRVLGQDLRILSAESNCSLYDTLLSAFSLLLHLYSGQRDFVIGSPTLNRGSDDVREMIGYFTNVQPVRARFDGVMTFLDLLHQVSEWNAAAQEDKAIPFARLLEMLNVKRSANHGPLVQTVFTFHNTPMDSAALVNSHFSILERVTVESQFDLTVEVQDDRDELSVRIEYLTDLLDRSTIERFANHFVTLLEKLVFDPELCIHEHCLLNENERSQQLLDWNATALSYPHDKCIHELLEAQARLRPDAVAVVHQGSQLSHGELNRRANRVAHWLREQGVGPEARVGICMERSPELAVGLLGILKAGGAYVPLDPEYPEARLEYMLAQSGCRVVLSEQHLMMDMPLLSTVKVLPLDAGLHYALLGAYSDANVEVADSGVCPTNLAYVIYTSGSTGQPKGSAIVHQNISRLIYNDFIDYGSVRTMLCAASPSFDAFTFELWGALLHGGRCVLADSVRGSFSELGQLVDRQGIDCAWLTSSLFNQQIVNSSESLRNLKRLVVGGEALSIEHIRQALRQLPQTELVNGYGPTENTTFSCTYVIREEALSARSSVPIGRPIGNTRAYVLGPRGEVVPVGVVGELYLGGAGLARGYLAQAGLTAEKFVPSAYAQAPGERLYRTGDLVRYLPDGDLEFIGRVDHQVKVRGFRIELGEIESVLRRHDAVREAVVLSREDQPGEHSLVAYVVVVKEARKARELQLSLLEHLRGLLPDYMVPAAIVLLDALPLTVNKKVDVSALPKPDDSAYARAAYEVPETAMEKVLAELWRENLGLEKVGADDNYFSIGGDSIRSISLVAAAKRRGLRFRVTDLFSHRTIKALARVTEAVEPGAEEFPELKQFSLLTEEERTYIGERYESAAIDDAFPLSTLQQGLIYHSLARKELSTYHDILTYRIRERWDRASFGRALAHVISRHGMLRTVFDLGGVRPIQVVLKHAEADIESVDIADTSETTRIVEQWIEKERQQGIDLSTRLWKIRVFVLPHCEFVLGMSFHHALYDGWSNATFLNELLTTYKNHDLEEAAPPSYRHFVALEHEALSAQQNLAYWRNKLEGARLPWWTGDLRELSASFLHEVPEASGNRLCALAATLGVQEKSVWTAIYLALISLLDGSNDVVASVATHGRPELPGSEKTLGLFVNSLPVRVDVTGMRWTDLILAVESELQALHAVRHFPLVQIQTHTGMKFSAALLNFVNFHVYEENIAGRQLVYSGGFEESNYCILFQVQRLQDLERYLIGVRLDPSVFDQDFRERIHGYVVAIIDRLLGQGSERIDRAALLGTTERTKLLATWNATAHAYPDDKCIHELFEEQVRVQPDAIALVHEDSQVSYGELNRRANQLAHCLIEAGAQPEARVGVCMDRSVEMVAAMLAVLKAGACYVPMDPGYPQDRLRYIGKDAGVSVVLTQSHLQGLLSAAPMCVDAMKASLQTYPEGNPSKGAIAANLAYVIYTSGSTGKPKGVGIQHRSALSFLTWVGATYGQGRMQSVLASTSICFDLSVYELFGPLSLGGECVIIDDILSLDQSLAQERVRLLNTVPSAIRALLSKNAIPAGVRTINLAGERLVPDLVDELYELGTVTDVHDLYGPSEATTYSTYARRSPQGIETIGRPVANTSIYVLRDGTLVPTGVPGEIFVGGDGLARGYLGRPGLTAERFVPDPFNDKAGARLYRTGDRGRHLPDGSLEYLGRLDQQIKLRGYRIELGEIESALLHQGDLREAVVVAHEADRDSTQLVAYVVPKQSFAGTGPVERQTDALAEEWRRVFDEELYRAAVGRESATGSDAKNWFDGWVSSYDRSPLGLEEMQVWADLAVARIRALEPQDILEVGCGLGLLALRLLPDCRSYAGSDFSRSALDALAANVPADHQTRVQLHCCEAKDFDAYQGRQFDAVILNSVVQYFPDVEYLLQTVAGALRHVRPGGALFIGDVRNYELLAALATSIELSKEAALVNVEALRAAVNSRLAKENELLVSPRFFEQLKGRFALITHVELLPKYDFSHQGIDNELFRYRYDVVLTVAGELGSEAVAEAVIDWRARGFDAEYFRSELAVGRQTLCMTHVPDTRLSRDLRIVGLLQANEAERKTSLRESIAREHERNAGGIAMDSYLAMAEEYGYRADVSLVGASRGEYCLHLRRPGWGRTKSVLAQPTENVELRLLASDPMRSRREAGLKSRIRDFLKERLPEHMVPAAFVVLPQLPLNPNGKVDRKALPPPDNNAFAREVYVSPGSRRERVLVEIWERVLNASRIGVKDNFFALGGDSILSIQVVSQARSRGFGLSTKAIFEHPTIESLALQMIDEVQAIPQRRSQGELTLLPIQRIFFRDNPQAVHHYHQSLLVCVPERFELAFLKAFVAAVYDRHDALRLRFSQREGQWKGGFCPVTNEVISASTVECDLGGLSEQERKASIARVGQSIKESIDITRGPLLRAMFFRADDWRHSRFLLVIHHLVVDGVSWRILLNDLEQAFGQWSSEKAIKLSPKTHGVDVWAQRLAAHCRENRLEEEKTYWISRLSSAVPSLPVDGEVQPADDCHGASEHVRVELSAALTGALLNSCHHAYGTRINDLLLSGLFLAVFKWTGQQALRIGLEAHGREELLDAIDVSQTVGWFTSLFPLTLRVSPTWSAGGQDSLQELIRSVKEELRTLPNNGIGYGLLRHLAADEALLRQREPTDILFNYLGQFDSVFHGAKSFSNASEPTGSNVGPKLRRTDKLVINSVVTDGRLSFDISFHPQTYARATVARFGSGLEQSLQEIVTHCRQQQRSRFSPSDFPLACLQQGEIDALQERYPQLADCYVASDLQSGLIFHALMDEGEGGADYTVQVYLTLEAQIDVARFKEAWDRVAERHDCFRSAFTGFERDQILQVVLDSVELPWTGMDWRDKSESELLAAFDTHARVERSAGFEFATAPLMRFTLIRERDARYRFLWTHHHSLLDGWSLGSVLGEVIGYYSELPAVAASDTGVYKDYLAWLRSLDPERAREFWTKELQAAERRVPLNLRPPAVGSRDIGNRVKTWRLSARQTRAIEALARHHKVTMNVVVLASWAYLLSRYSASDTVVLGQTVSGRDPSIRHVEKIVGLLIRTIPVCVEVEGSLAIGDWLTRLHALSVERERYSYYPLPEIQQCSGLAASEVLFDSLVVFENYPVDEVLQDAARPGSGRRRNGASLPIGLIGTHETTNYDLTLLVMPMSELSFKLSYRAERFAQESIDQLMRHFLVVLDGMAAGKCSTVAQLPLLSAQERQQQLIGWNATARAYANDRCTHELFEEQVERTPGAMAVLHEGRSLTYQELNGRANQLARRLGQMGVGPDQRVALCAERSVEMVVGVLGILKAGAAYVPLDPNYPIERLRYMLEDAAPRVVLTQEKLKDLLPQTQAERVTLDAPPAGAVAGGEENLSTVELGLTSRHLVYVIYTSGSTGRPKGTAMPHRAMVNLIEWHRRDLALDAGARVLQFASLSFDVAFQETFSTLCAGGTLVLIDEWVRRDARALLELLHSQSVQRLFVPPLMLQSLAESFRSSAPGPLSLKDVITAGEQLRISAEIADFFSHLPGCRVHNHYGPTETHVVTALTLTGDPQQWPALPTIGQPISNTQIYILDVKRQPVPLGVVGEIYIGGANVARGYLDRAELTAERFVRDPFNGDEQARLYKTGDLGRWLEDGTVEYLGRNDDQVKVRGYRIELGEIESQLARHAQVREAAVVAREDIAGNQRLVAYVTQSEDGLSIEELRGSLKEALPEHMVPSAFVILERLPRTPSGKLNRRALPAPELSAYVTQEYEAPQGEIEGTIARIWRDILDVQQVSRQDNFFELGGHSLLAMQLVSRIREAFSTELPVRQVFERATLSSQARAVEQARDAAARTEIPLEAVSREGPLPLSYAQQRMLFLQEYMK